MYFQKKILILFYSNDPKRMISKGAILIGHVLSSLFSSFYRWKNRLKERPLAHNPFIRVTHSSFISSYLLPHIIHFGLVEMKFPQPCLVNIDFSICNTMLFPSFWGSMNSYSHLKNFKTPPILKGHLQESQLWTHTPFVCSSGTVPWHHTTQWLIIYMSVSPIWFWAPWR